MTFEVRHLFDVAPNALWNALFNPEYEQVNAERSGLPRETISDELLDGHRVRRQRVHSRRDLPGVAAKALGNTKLTYEIVEKYDETNLVMTWEVFPSVLTDKIKATGSYQVLPAPGGCERLVKGEVSVSIPFVGGRIERAITDELQSSYEKNIDFVRDWVTDHT